MLKKKTQNTKTFIRIQERDHHLLIHMIFSQLAGLCSRFYSGKLFLIYRSETPSALEAERIVFLIQFQVSEKALQKLLFRADK